MNYRYRLGRLTGVCPQCRRHTFKYYIDTVTGAKAGDYLGRCNREVKCGYHRRPTGNRPLTAAEATASLFDRPADDALSTIPREVYERLPPVNTDDNLCHYLSRRYGIGMVQQACRYFGVSHARFAGGSSAFWLIDRMGYIRSAKVMAYDRATGHRVKSTNRMPVSYAHALMRLPDFNYRACYFGEAAACDRLHADAKLILVESEKTALVVNLELMRCGRSADYVCVATGGASMLRVDPAMMESQYYRGTFLRGRRLVVLPDADMVATWRLYADSLIPYVTELHFIDVREPPFSLTGSQDIAGHTLDGMSKDIDWSPRRERSCG